MTILDLSGINKNNSMDYNNKNKNNNNSISAISDPIWTKF